MAGIIIQSDNDDSLRLVTDLAESLGVQMIKIDDDFFEDTAFGHILTKTKTGKEVDRSSIMKKLRS